MRGKAERSGFEPTRRLDTAYAISSRAPSANSDTSPGRGGKFTKSLSPNRPVVPPPLQGYASGMDEAVVRPAWWEPGAVCLLDQRRLPQERATVRCISVAEVADAIRQMVVRGAPAIGV